MADVRGEPVFEKQPFVAESQPPEPSGVEADERAYEQSPESREHFLEEEDSTKTKTNTFEAQPSTATGVAAPAPSVVQPVRDEVTLRVEKILEEGMGSLYADLPDSAKPLFKEKGEEAASQIAEMVRTLKVEVAKVVRLIRDWLLTVPKANKFYLEQEAKIKTDAIIDYVDARKEELSSRP